MPGEWNDGDNWQALVRDGVRIMVARCPDALPPADRGDHSDFAFLATDDADSLFAEFTARDALMLVPPGDRPWGWREMAVATPHGHRLMFAQAL